MSRSLDNFMPNLAVLGHPRKPLLALDLSVVTPIFGGGIVAREVDYEHPVSAKSVRGHLRFWWRACRGAAFATPQELFVRESLIWGSTEMPAAVGVEVEAEPLEKVQEIRFDQWKNVLPRYALFPFHPQQGSQGQLPKPGVSCLKGVRFRLRLTGGEAHRADVEAAVWAWVMFGGVGARTRRGCGTLFCESEQFGPSLNSLEDGASRHVVKKDRYLPIASLCKSRVLVGPPRRSMTNGQNPILRDWGVAVAAMQEFRQGEGVGRRAGPSRSFWPEPDSIRDLTGEWLHPHHAPELSEGHYYPRADLGLPIVFKFINKEDPGKRTLQVQGNQATRMASPIILKALPLPGDMAAPMVLLLDAPHVWDADTPPVGFGNVALPINELNDVTKSASVKPLRGKATAREAFMDFTKNKWAGLEVSLP